MIGNKGQIAIEFIIMIMVGLAFVITLIIIALNLSDYAFKEQIDSEVTDLAKSIQNELILASELEPGYHREIYIPTNIRGRSFSITNTETSFTLKPEGVPQVTLEIPKIDNGNLKIGKNVIINENNKLIIQ